MAKMVVTIQDNKPCEIERFDNEFSIGKRKIQADDLMRAIVSTMEPVELTGLLMEKNFQGALGDFLDEKADEIDVVTSGKLFTLLIERMKKGKIEPDMFSNLVEVIIKNMKSTSEMLDGEVYKKLMNLLLEKIQVQEENKAEIISAILSVAVKDISVTDNQKELETLFKAIYKKGKPEWVNDYLDEIVSTVPLYEGFMPKNIVYYRRTLNKDYVVIEVPKSMRDVMYQSVKFKGVGHPRMLFFFEVKNEKIVTIKIACIKGPFINAETELYLYPFSHVHHKHNVCWSYGEYEIDSLDKLQHIPYVFISTPNAGHYNPDTLDIFKALEGKEFDDDKLIPSGVKFKELIEE